jgi:WD40 repeat protein
VTAASSPPPAATAGCACSTGAGSNPRNTLRTGQNEVDYVAFAGDSRHLATTGSDGTVHVFDLRRPTAPATILRAGRTRFGEVAFAGDGRHLAGAGDDDGTIYIFDWRTPATPPTILQTGLAGVGHVAFSADSRHVAGAGDEEVRVLACLRCGPLQDVIALARNRLPDEVAGTAPRAP